VQFETLTATFKTNTKTMTRVQNLPVILPVLPYWQITGKLPVCYR